MHIWRNVQINTGKQGSIKNFKIVVSKDDNTDFNIKMIQSVKNVGIPQAVALSRCWSPIYWLPNMSTNHRWSKAAAAFPILRAFQQSLSHSQLSSRAATHSALTNDPIRNPQNFSSLHLCSLAPVICHCLLMPWMLLSRVCSTQLHPQLKGGSNATPKTADDAVPCPLWTIIACLFSFLWTVIWKFMLLFPVLLSCRGQIVSDLKGKTQPPNCRNNHNVVGILLATRSEELWKFSVFSVQ